LAITKNKKRDNSTESSRLVLLLNGFQVVRILELLGLLECVDYIRNLSGWRDKHNNEA